MCQKFHQIVCTERPAETTRRLSWAAWGQDMVQEVVSSQIGLLVHLLTTQILTYEIPAMPLYFKLAVIRSKGL